MNLPLPGNPSPENNAGREVLAHTPDARWVASVVAEVVARLAARENHVFTTTPQQLAPGLAPTDFTRYAEVHIHHADNHFLAQLAGQSGGSPAIQSVLGALAWGLRVQISLHPQLLPCLPVKALARMPVSFSDLEGHTIWLLPQALISYRDIATKKQGWVVVSRQAHLTPLAKETLAPHQLQLIRQE